VRISKQAEGRYLVKVNLGGKSFIGKTDSPQAAWERAEKFMQDDFTNISISKIREPNYGNTSNQN
jgi:hypothetical protein